MLERVEQHLLALSGKSLHKCLILAARNREHVKVVTVDHHVLEHSMYGL